MTISPQDLNGKGTVFGGRVLAVADMLAGYVAMKHSELECVTFVVDSAKFLCAAREGDILIFKACVNRVWGASLEVGVKVFIEDIINNKLGHMFSAYFTLVAVDKNGKPKKMDIESPPLTPEQKRRHNEAQERREYRIKTSRPN